MCGSARCALALISAILSVTVRASFPASCRAAGYKYGDFFRWSDGLSGSPLSSLGTAPVVGHGAYGKLGGVCVCVGGEVPCRIIV